MTPCKMALSWMLQGTVQDKPTLVQVMTWCCLATCQYPSQCWPRSTSPHGVTILQPSHRSMCVSFDKLVGKMLQFRICIHLRYDSYNTLGKTKWGYVKKEQVYTTEYCGIQLIIHGMDTCFWHIPIQLFVWLIVEAKQHFGANQWSPLHRHPHMDM